MIDGFPNLADLGITAAVLFLLWWMVKDLRNSLHASIAELAKSLNEFHGKLIDIMREALNKDDE